MHREKEFGLNNRKSLYSPLQPKPPFLQIDRPLTSDKDPLLWRQNRSTVSPLVWILNWFLFCPNEAIVILPLLELVFH
jgi:hypothetical protein